jgi:hypothetical protein
MAVETKSKRTSDPFKDLCDEQGLVDNNQNNPFLPYKEKVGDFVLGTVVSSKDVTFVPKKGKNKGKKQETTYFTFEVEETNIASVVVGQTYTISPSGLLLYQLTKGLPKGLEMPFKVAIKYEGQDAEDRHQTRVAYPKA